MTRKFLAPPPCPSCEVAGVFLPHSLTIPENSEREATINPKQLEGILSFLLLAEGPVFCLAHL